MKRAAPFLAIALAGCSINDLAASSVASTYPSAKRKDEVAECLMDRLASIGRLERRTVGDTVQVTVTSGAARVGIYAFTIRDQGTGSLTELRKLKALSSPGLHNAETCF